MGLFDSLKIRMNNLMKRGSSLNFRMFSVGTQEVYTHIDTEKAITEGYNANTAVYSILQKDAQKFASISQYIQKDDESGEEVEGTKLGRLLERPNEYQGSDAFRETVRLYRKLTGEAFIWLNRGILADGLEGTARLSKPVLEMMVLPSNHVILVPDPNNLYGVLGYLLDVGGQPLPIAKEDIIHWKGSSLLFDPSTRDYLRGQSPLSAGYKTLQQNNSATDASVRMYQNDGAKGVLTNKTLDRMDAKQRQAVDAVIGRKINNNDIKGAVATLQGEWAYIDLGKSNTDLQLLEGKNLSMQELCFLFDVPYEFFDSRTTFANKEQAQKGWMYNSIIPSCRQYDDELNRVLLPAFGIKGVKIASDFDDLPELREDVSQLVSSLAQAWWITGNEKREWMGFDPEANELMNEVMVPAGVVPISQTGLSMDEVARQLNEQGLND
jgi:HK97 family phage portal protein